MKRLSAAILVLCAALPASAQMYKWVDSNGKVQYSDSPPPGNVKTERLRNPPGPAGAGDTGDSEGSEQKKDAAKAGPKTSADLEFDFRKRRVDAAKAQAEADKKAADARAKEESCNRARAALSGLETGGRQVRFNDKGERVFLDDDQIAQEKARAANEAAKQCN
jgi:hypothetical protein